MPSHTKEERRKRRKEGIVVKQEEDRTDPLRPGASPPKKFPTTNLPSPEPRRFSVGGVKVSKEEFNAARAAAGFRGGSRGAIVTPETRELLGRTKLGPEPIAPTDAEIIAKARLAEEERNKERERKEEPIIEEPVLEQEGQGFGGALRDILTAPPPGLVLDAEGKLVRDPSEFAAEAGLAVIPGGRLLKVGKGLSLPISKQAEAIKGGKGLVSKTLKSIGGLLKTNVIKFGLGAGATIFGVSKVLGTPKRRLQNIDTSQSQYREAISMPLEAVRISRLDPLEGIDILQEFEDQMNDYGRQLNEMIIVKGTELDEQVVDAAIVRNNKIIGFIDNAQFILQKSEIAGETNPEEIALLIESMRNFERSLQGT